MAPAIVSPVFLRLEGVLAGHVVDLWRDPFEEFPCLQDKGTIHACAEKLFRVEVSYHSDEERTEESLIYAETLEADHGPAWTIEPHPSFFFQREWIFHRSPMLGRAIVDLSDIGRISIEKGLLQLGLETFSSWEEDQAVETPAGQARYFLCGQECPGVTEALFEPALDLDRREWMGLIKEAPFIRHHTRSVQARGQALPVALAHGADFVEWLLHLPEERIGQLMVAPATMEKILREKCRDAGRSRDDVLPGLSQRP